MTYGKPGVLWSPFGWYYGWVIVGAAMVINVASAVMNPVIFAFFLQPMGSDMGWSRGEMSLTITFRLLAGGVSGPFVGQLLDRFGPRWIGVATGLAAGACLVAISGISDLWLLYGVYALSGLAGLGSPGPLLMTMVPVGKWFVVQRGRAMALAIVGLPLGVVLTIPLAQGLIDAIGWRSTWAVFGVAVAVIFVVVSWLFLRRAPEDHGLLPDGALAPPTYSTLPVPPAVKAIESDWSLGEVMRHPTAWTILAAQVLFGFAVSGTLVHRVAFWQDQGISTNLVALGTAVDPLTVVFSILIFGFFAERVPLRVLGLAGGLIFALSMLPMIFITGEAYAIFMHTIVWGIAAGPFTAANNLVWANYFGRKALGAIQGVAVPVAVVANGVSAPAYGYLFDLGVEPSLVWSMSLALFAGCGMLLFAARPPVRKAEL